MKGTNIFSGKKLSEQTQVATSGIDQRLFAPSASPPRPAAPTGPAAPHAVLKSALLLPETAEPAAPAAAPPHPARQPAEPTPAPEAPERFEFDLTALPHRKDSFLFTTEEFEALEDLKLAVGRALDIKVTKQNLMRCALAALIDDWRRKGVSSAIIAPLKRRGR